MNRYFVHRYDVIRVKVAVCATSQAEAIENADHFLDRHHPIPNRYNCGPNEEELFATNHGVQPVWLKCEYADEVTGYLVDEFNDPSCDNSKWYDPEGREI